MTRPAPVPARPGIDRFLEHVEAEGDCWRWTAQVGPEGYGQFWSDAQKSTRAHRWSYEFHVAEIPRGLQLDHLCRNRACVNPWHLEPVTPRVNTMRGATVASANAAKTHCIAGHPLSGANLYVPAKTGKRECRACRREAVRRHHNKRQSRAIGG